MGELLGTENQLRLRAALAVLNLILVGIAPARAVLAASDIPLQIDPPRFDAGWPQQGTQVTMEFVIINTTAEDIRLRYIFAECDCTITVTDHAIVARHDRYLLTAELNLAEVAVGPLSEVITILTDNAAQPEINIPVTATVVGNLEDLKSGTTWRSE